MVRFFCNEKADRLTFTLKAEVLGLTTAGKKPFLYLTYRLKVLGESMRFYYKLPLLIFEFASILCRLPIDQGSGFVKR